jgi:hypothetical protein
MKDAIGKFAMIADYMETGSPAPRGMNESANKEYTDEDDMSEIERFVRHCAYGANTQYHGKCVRQTGCRAESLPSILREIIYTSEP